MSEPTTTELELAWRESLESGGTPELAPCRKLAERLIHEGERFKAYDVIGQGLNHWKDDVQLRQLYGYALTQTGAPREAYDVFRDLYDKGHHDGETLGMLARACKELGRLDEAFSCYDEGYRIAVAANDIDGAYYTGINAATTALLLGDRVDARKRAAEVRDKWASQRTDYWALATLGEAALLHEDLETAARHYREAARLAGDRHAHVASMAKQARAVAEALDLTEAALDDVLRIPSVVVFSGHMIDAPDRAIPRFPPGAEEQVAQGIAQQLETINAGIGYASVACGSDILFAEAMFKRGAEFHATLPCPPEEFIARSVAFAGAGWLPRARTALDKAKSVLVASGDRALDNPLSFEYVNRIMLGRARLNATALAGHARGLAVWNGEAADGPGGTASAVARWHDRNMKMAVVAPLVAVPKTSPSVPAERMHSDRKQTDGDVVRFEFASILFADAVGFSKLNERQVREFSIRYLGAIADLIGGCEEQPLAKNTWGDGLYVVFRTPDAAGRFALDLVDLVANTDWAGDDSALPGDLDIRVALHCGPTYGMIDPLTNRPTFMGSHVSQAARIEPITPPGHVYASGAFAAMAEADGISEFKCTYCGRVPLAKGFGTFPLYHVRRD